MEISCPICNNNFDPDTNPSCPFCGFKRAGATQRFDPIMLDSSVEEPSDSGGSAATFRVVRGPQTGTVFQFNGNELRLGRSPHCEIFLNDMTVSRDHATIERTAEGSYAIRDNHSYNGLWVNNAPVDSTVLADGDFVQVGAFCLLFHQN